MKLGNVHLRLLKSGRLYYYQNVYPKEHLIEIGKKLYVKVTEVMRAEIDEITEEDCINYVINLVINRTFDGYMTEKKTIYEQLQDILGVKIEPILMNGTDYSMSTSL